MKRSLTTAPILDTFVLLAILLIGFIYTSSIFEFLDIGLYDESSYLASGLVVHRNIPAAEDAPLYAFWYRLLSFVKNDSIDLYFFNYRVITVLPAAVLFAALRASGVARIVSVALSLGLLLSSANFPIWPKVSHFALAVLLLGVLVAGLSKNRLIKVAVVLVTSLVASYARPEYFLSSLLFGVLFVFLLGRQIKSDGLKSVLPVSAVLVVISISALLYLGAPIASGNRSMVAFGQHYSLNWVKWHEDNRNPWTNWETIIRNDFGDAKSVGGALASNPKAFGRHVLTNVLNTPSVVAATFLSSYPSNRWARVGVTFGILLILLSIVVHIGGTITVKDGGATGLRGGVRRAWFEILTVSILLVPSAISVLAIYPREHYLLIAGVLAAFATIVALTKDSGEHDWRSFEAVLLVCGLALLMVRPLSPQQGEGSQTNLKIIEFLRTLDIKQPVNILEAAGGYGIYVGDNFNRIAEYDKKEPWARFLAETAINLILLSDTLARDTRFAEDREWRSFLDDPQKWGFAYLNIPGVKGHRLIYKEGLLARVP